MPEILMQGVTLITAAVRGGHPLVGRELPLIDTLHPEENHTLATDAARRRPGRRFWG
jgi:hypothetical protein